MSPMSHKKHQPRRNTCRARNAGTAGGFTLVELAIVIMISGLMLANFLQLYGTYNTDRRQQTTKEHLELAQAAVVEFYGRKGRYPCPANPDLPPTDGNYGREVCPASPVSTGGACPAGIICDNTGTRDVDVDGTDDFVLIGAIPFTTLFEEKATASFVPANGVDGWDTLFKYAVSDRMADFTRNKTNPVDPFSGVITLVDENNNSITEPPTTTHYIIMSHGENRKGGWTPGGENLGGCLVSATTLPTPPGNSVGTAGQEPELENCDDNDGIFVKALQSIGDNDQYFDDYIFYKASAPANLWLQAVTAPSGELYLYNSNWDIGWVGVGTPLPQAMLDVAGDIRAEDAIKAEGLTAADGNFCDSAGANCLKPKFLGGDCGGVTCTDGDQTCPPGEAATGIEDNHLICAPLFNTSAILPIADCPAGEFITGISTSGDRHCAPP